jgi:hypothetical protein
VLTVGACGVVATVTTGGTTGGTGTDVEAVDTDAIGIGDCIAAVEDVAVI